MQVDRMISEIEEAYKGWKIGKRIRHRVQWNGSVRNQQKLWL